MTDKNDMLAAIAAERARRLKRELRWQKACILLLIASAIGIVSIVWSLHIQPHNAVTAENEPPLFIEEGPCPSAEPRNEFAEVNWDHWLSVNPNIVGWVTIEDTNIDHPIVMASAESPTYYLSHDIDGRIDAKGCIFLDEECDEGLDSMHSVVYGHNLNGNLMFADLARYAEEGFATSHPHILLQTPRWKKRLEVQCVEIADGTDDSNVVSFASESEMGLWYEERFRASAIRLESNSMEHEGIERIYTFCTCADGVGDKRVLVYAIPATNARAASRESASTA